MATIDKSLETEVRLVISDYLGLGGLGGKGSVTTKEHRVSFGDDENVPKVLVVMVAQLCEDLKIVHFKWANFMVCKLYLDKTLSPRRGKQHLIIILKIV